MEISLIRPATMVLDYFAAFMLSLILLCCALEKNKTNLLKLYMGMAGFCVASLVLEGSSYAVQFGRAARADEIRMVLSVVAVMGGYGLSLCYACYVANLAGIRRRICRVLVRACVVGAVAGAMGLVAGSLGGWFFSIQGGDFVPGRFFVAIFAYDILACSAGIFLIIRCGGKLNRQDVVALLSLPSFIFVSAALQYTSLGIMLGLFLMCAVSLFIIYLMIQTDRNRRTADQEKRMMDMNVTMMLSRIQPHFL